MLAPTPPLAIGARLARLLPAALSHHQPLASPHNSINRTALLPLHCPRGAARAAAGRLAVAAAAGGRGKRDRMLDVERDVLPDGKPNTPWRRLKLRIQTTISVQVSVGGRRDTTCRLVHAAACPCARRALPCTPHHTTPPPHHHHTTTRRRAWPLCTAATATRPPCGGPSTLPASSCAWQHCTTTGGV
jgi:hypothetical protein